MGKHTFTTEETRKAHEAAKEARKKAPSRREKMARYAQTFDRQRADYGKHKHKLIGLPLVDKIEKGSMAAARQSLGDPLTRCRRRGKMWPLSHKEY
jgi:hypothetical protein